jgi:predicted tellurium resistance membrane protein TerC
MTHTQLTPFLRRVLLFDATTCAIFGFVLLAAGDALGRLLAIPASLAYGAAVVLLIFAAAVAYVGTRRELLWRAVWTIVVLNALWAVESVLALVAGRLEPDALGRSFIVAQAVAVAVIVELQIIGLRRAKSVQA